MKTNLRWLGSVLVLACVTLVPTAAKAEVPVKYSRAPRIGNNALTRSVHNMIWNGELRGRDGRRASQREINRDWAEVKASPTVAKAAELARDRTVRRWWSPLGGRRALVKGRLADVQINRDRPQNRADLDESAFKGGFGQTTHSGSTTVAAIDTRGREVERTVLVDGRPPKGANLKQSLGSLKEVLASGDPPVRLVHTPPTDAPGIGKPVALRIKTGDKIDEIPIQPQSKRAK